MSVHWEVRKSVYRNEDDKGMVYNVGEDAIEINHGGKGIVEGEEGE